MNNTCSCQLTYRFYNIIYEIENILAEVMFNVYWILRKMGVIFTISPCLEMDTGI